MSKQEKNKFKKADANGNELAEQIGKGINEEQTQKALEARKNNDIMSFKLPMQLKDDLQKYSINPSELLRAFIRGYVSERKLRS
jgi:hypothetical protein